VVVRVEVEPRLLRWAQERSRLDHADLVRRFPKLEAWEQREAKPTLKQLDSFAQATRTPVGFLFLPEPPQETVPIPDYRTIADRGVGQPSADLLDTIFQCQQRQEWYHDYARVNGEPPVALVGSLTATTSPTQAAATMRSALQFEPSARGSSWSDALRILAERAEDLGVLVMTNGVVGSNTHRKLDPEEFRGFALVDDLAPLVFINGADTKAAQIFTLAHELAHLWLGESALSDSTIESAPAGEVEQWCNRAAAELLVPLADIANDFDDAAPITEELERLARRFRVSTLVVLRRVHDAGHLTTEVYRGAYRDELRRVLDLMSERGSSGGNFYATLPVRTSRRFARALVTSTLEGQTLHRDAFRMLGFKKFSTFEELAGKLGVG